MIAWAVLVGIVSIPTFFWLWAVAQRDALAEENKMLRTEVGFWKFKLKEKEKKQ